ncbi:MAG: molecular chaperone TorD family protein [Lysobacterales bacterium]
MTNLQDNAAARSQLFQLLALGFVHPVAECHQLMVNGNYPLALARASQAAYGIDTEIGQPQNQFADFEAAYIDLFQVGKRGQPVVHLSAGDYKELLGSGSRPEFLLEYSGCYRHFGLKTNEDDQANELPDHIVCQLEFLAWLSHLEQSSADKPDLQRGYQCAQRDFCERHLQQFLELLVTALQKENRKSPINPFFLNLSILSLEAVIAMQNQFHKALGDSVGLIDNPEQNASANLWG